MHHRINHRLEDRPFAELRQVHAPRILVRRDAPVANQEAQRVADLPVERTVDVECINLPAGVGPVSAIAHRLDPGVRQPLARILRCKEHAAYRCPQRSLRVVLHELQLRQGDLGRLVDARPRVPPPQFRLKAIDAGAANYLRVGGCSV